MAMQFVTLNRTFDVPVHILFAHMCQHEKVGKLFAPSRFIHIQDGETTKYGVGSKRSIVTPLMPVFKEQVTAYIDNQLIEYKIVAGSAPVKAHLGRLVFTAIDGGHSRLDYTIQFKGRVPFTGGILRKFMQLSLGRSLRRLKL